MKIFLVGAEFFDDSERTDRQSGANSRSSQFCEGA